MGADWGDLAKSVCSHIRVEFGIATTELMYCFHG